MLAFDEASHTYTWNGARVPNVTRVLGDLVDYAGVPPAVLENARQEGVAIHRMIELDAKGDLDVDTLPEWLKPRYDALQKFKRETRFSVISSEERVFHSTYRYAGTLDLFGTIHDDTFALIDAKRSLFMGDVIGLQTAAYAGARDSGAQVKAMRVGCRAALLLKDNGTYKLEEYRDKNDFNIFLACLTRFVWKESRK